MELRECPSYPRWRVSECGTVVEYKSRFEYRGWLCRRIYRLFNKKSRRAYNYATSTTKGEIRPVHQLVADAWVGTRAGRREQYVCHRDDDTNNNHASNLYYGNAITNQKDAERNGGWKARGVMLTDDQVRLAYSRCVLGEKVRAMAAELGITQGCLSNRFRVAGFPRLPVRNRHGRSSRISA